MEYPWLLTRNNIKGLKWKNVRSISTSTIANNSDILAELTPLMTSGLTSITKDKSTELKKTEAHSAKLMQNRCKAMHQKTKKLWQLELANLVIISVHIYIRLQIGASKEIPE